jgi:hypothetical protein
MTDLLPIASTPRLDKSGPAVLRAIEGKHRAAFEAEFQAVLAEVAETFDVPPRPGGAPLVAPCGA